MPSWSEFEAAAPELAERVRERLPQARVVQLDDGAALDRVLEEAASECEVLGIAGGDGSVAAAQFSIKF